MKIAGIHHIKLTVSNLQKSKEFYSKFPNFKLVAEYEGFVMFYSGSFYLGLTDHKGDLSEKKFNEKNVGLDHIAFELDSAESLKEAMTFLDENKIEHSELQNLSNGTIIIVFRDPDNIQLEFSFKK